MNISKSHGIIVLLFTASLVTNGFAAVYTVKSGETVRIDDASVGKYADGIAFADKTGIVEFDLSAAPSMAISGGGTIRKVSSADWTMIRALSSASGDGFTGTYDLTGPGVVTFSSGFVFGSKAGDIYVRDGATLDFASNSALVYGRKVHIAGFGKGGIGAITFSGAVVNTGGDMIRTIILESDSLLSLPKGGTKVYQSWDNVTLNGKRLYYRSGSGSAYTLYSGTLKGEGEVVASGTSGNSATLALRKYAVEPSETSPFVLGGYGAIAILDYSAPIDRPLWVSGTGNLLSHGESGFTGDFYGTNMIAWTGTVAFTNESGKADLSVFSSQKNNQFSVLGSITGSGTVAVPKENVGRLCLGGRNSTFSGGLTVDNSKGGQILALYPGSLSDYSSVSCSYGHLDVALLPGESAGWTGDSFKQLANAATWLNGAFPAFDVSAYGGELPEITLPDGIANANGIGANGRIGLVGFPANFHWVAGTAVVCGQQKVEPSAVWIQNGSASFVSNASVSAVLEFSGGAEAAFGKDPVRIGYGKVTDFGQLGRMVVKNAYLHNQKEDIYQYDAGQDYALAVGCDSDKWTSSPVAGVLEVCEGAVVSNKILVGGWNATEGCGRGLVVQRGGKVVALGATKNAYLASGLGMGETAQGHYQMYGGEFTALGSFIIGDYNTGSWTQFGGVSTFTNFPGNASTTFGVGKHNGGWGFIDLRGGKMDVFGAFTLQSGQTSASSVKQGRASLAVDGADAMFDSHDYCLEMNAAEYNGKTTVALAHGGSLRAAGFFNSNGTDKEWASLGFDGGTFICGGEGADVFAPSGSDATKRRTTNLAKGLNLVSVHKGGAAVDTDGRTGNFTAVDIVGATGGGVMEVPLGNPITGVDGCVPPYVDITGDGQGASAVAEFDTESGCVTNIRVTCAGVGYTEATATLWVAKTAKVTYACTIGANDNSGSFTKKGVGDFTLKGAGSWGGETILAGGTLRLGSANALPAGTKVVLAGGALDANGFGAPTDWEIDVRTVLASGGAVKCPGAMFFPVGATLTVKGTEALADITDETIKNIVLLEVEGALENPPKPTGLSGTVADKWHLSWSGKRLRAVRNSGMCLLVR